MSWLADLLKEYPALSVAKEHLALVEERLRIADVENDKLKTENAELKKRIPVFVKASNFIEYKGTLWKQLNGRFELLLPRVHAGDVGISAGVRRDAHLLQVQLHWAVSS